MTSDSMREGMLAFGRNVLVARATVLSSGKRRAACACRIVAIDAGEEKLVAAAQGTISKIEPRA